MKSFITFHPFGFFVIAILIIALVVKSADFSKRAKKRINLSPKAGAAIVVASCGGFLIAAILTSSVVIALPFATLTSCVPYLLAKRKREKSIFELQSQWPEILDHIISGMQSGLSLAETLAALSKRGPGISQPIFLAFHKKLLSGADFSHALQVIKDSFQDPIADQVCEVLQFAKSSGSRDTSITLRTLADFVRSDLAIRSEISAKHGWIRNSAALASVAPWILLLLLASQPNTVKAYSSPSGVAILIIGVALTVVAYFWMNRVGRIRQVPRIFS
jgi:tight adherence protein B